VHARWWMHGLQYSAQPTAEQQVESKQALNVINVRSYFMVGGVLVVTK
jgi:hypothetical protein